MAKNNKQKGNGREQGLNTPMFLRILYKAWMVLYAALKIVGGALLTVLVIGAICLLVFVNIAGDYLEDDIMENAVMSLGDYDLELNSCLYYVEDGQIKEYQPVYAVISREWATYDEIPENLINAAIAIEDHRFYEHQGVDWITTFKAVVRMFFGNDDAGGSSITQQLVKNVTKESGVTVQRKVLEIFKATQLEKQYDKKIIMEEYLNRIYLGQSCYGVKTAAASYFGKELENLTLAECAALISITNSPTYYDPWQNYDNNKERKEDVLWAMKAYGMITEEEYTEAMEQEIVLKSGIDFEDRITQCANEECGYRGVVGTLVMDGERYFCPKCQNEVSVEEDYSGDVYSWYTDVVLEDVAKALAEKDGMEWNKSTETLYKKQIQHGGYSIYTCLDMDVQNQVDKIYKDLTQIPSTRSGQQAQSAIVVKNAAGDIVALAGGVGPDKEFDDWNRATDSKLQSGSSIKPLSVYAPAFESGAITPATVIKDLPMSYNVFGYGPYPRNDTLTYNYSKTILSGVTSSTNTIACNTLQRISAELGFEFATEKFKLSTLVEEYTNSNGTISSDIGYGPLAMGAQTFGVSVREMADAFHVFANKGVYVEGRTFTKVYDSEGNLVLDNVQNTEQVLSEKTVDYMNYCLVSATQIGTGTDADLSNSWSSVGITTAGKTGTTANVKDKWYCGFTGYYTAAVWFGYDNPEVIHLTSGNYNPAARLWKKVMEPLHKGLSNIPLYNANKFSYVTVCLDSGKVATDACGADVRVELVGLRRTSTAGVYPQDYPLATCDKHVSVDYCSGGGVATEYCKHFAEVDPAVKIQKKSLVKMTKQQMEELLRAVEYGLVTKYYVLDEYIYMVDNQGNDATFKGFYNNANNGVDAPYLVCTKHTQAAWEEFQESNTPEEEPELEIP